MTSRLFLSLLLLPVAAALAGEPEVCDRAGVPTATWRASFAPGGTALWRPGALGSWWHDEDGWRRVELRFPGEGIAEVVDSDRALVVTGAPRGRVWLQWSDRRASDRPEDALGPSRSGGLLEHVARGARAVGPRAVTVGGALYAPGEDGEIRRVWGPRGLRGAPPQVHAISVDLGSGVAGALVGGRVTEWVDLYVRGPDHRRWRWLDLGARARFVSADEQGVWALVTGLGEDPGHTASLVRWTAETGNVATWSLPRAADAFGQDGAGDPWSATRDHLRQLGVDEDRLALLTTWGLMCARLPEDGVTALGPVVTEVVPEGPRAMGWRGDHFEVLVAPEVCGVVVHEARGACAALWSEEPGVPSRDAAVP